MNVESLIELLRKFPPLSPVRVTDAETLETGYGNFSDIWEVSIEATPAGLVCNIITKEVAK